MKLLYNRQRPSLFLGAALLLLLLFTSPDSEGNGVGLTAVTPDHSLLFIQNEGQFPKPVLFQAQAGEQTLWLTADSLWLTLPATTASAAQEGVHLKLTFPDAAPSARWEPFNPQKTVVSYGNPAGGQAAVPVWDGVRYRGLYPGVDLELQGFQGGLAWRWVVAEEVSQAQVALQVEGAERLAGDWVETAVGDYRLPFIGAAGGTAVGDQLTMQMQVSTSPWLSHQTAPSPTSLVQNGGGLLYSTFVGGPAWDQGTSLAVDDSGAAYVVGHTESISGFPSKSGPFSDQHRIDIYLLKLNPSGTAMDYLIWFAIGDNEDKAFDITVDDSGHAYVAGKILGVDPEPNVCDFFGPVPGYEPNYKANADGYLFKVTAAGDGLDYCTYLGGNNTDFANSVAVDDSGYAYVLGGTWSADFPVTNEVYDPTHNGARDLFLTKVSPDGLSLTYSTFIGGAAQDEGLAVAVDDSGAAYLGGWTGSADFPVTLGAFDVTYNGGISDAFIARVNPDGRGLTYATFIGGAGNDQGRGLAINDGGDVYLTGATTSAFFPVSVGAFDVSFGGGACDIFICPDGFVLKLLSDGSNLVYSSYLGGSGDDSGADIVVDDDDRAYVTGLTASPNGIPITPLAYDPDYSGNIDSYLLVVNPAGSQVEYGTFLGSTAEERGLAVGLDNAGDIYLSGWTQSPDFPVTGGSYDPVHNGDSDLYISKLSLPNVSNLYIPLIVGE